jgi:hypothetical protein
MHADHAVVDLSPIAVILPAHSHRVVAALGRAGFVDAADGLGMRMLLRHDLLTAIAQLLFVPLQRLDEALQRSHVGSKSLGNSLNVLPLHVGKQPFDIHSQQIPTFAANEAIGEQSQKRNELASKRGDLL